MKRAIVAATALCLAAVPLWAGEAEKPEEAKPVAPKEKTVLFNGKDLAGWKLFLPPGAGVDPAAVWTVKDGVIHCAGKPNGYIRTETAYTNYRLHLEWRWVEKGSNSGLLLHTSGPDHVWPKCIEAQLMADNAGDIYLLGGTSVTVEGKEKKGGRVPKRADSNEKPIGEWNTYDVVCAGDTIRLTVNGLLQNDVAGASVVAGTIGLQSEGAPIEFRNIYLEPAGEAKPEKPLDFTLSDQDGNLVTLSALADRIVVLEWMNFDCPYSVRHYERGTFSKLLEKYKDKGVVWLAVNSTHYATVEKNKAFAESRQVPYPILDDHAGDVGRLFGAKTSPHIFILKGGKIVYQGAIDDDPGGKNEAPTNYVDKALEELTAGKPVTLPETGPYGCSVKYAPAK